ncbi:MAG: hypothetical protein QG611_1313 [Bacteroidota bacterium]|nr:hypothetical protein [Bacteroidota bacterium]
MKEFFKKHIYKILIISLIFNLIGFLYVAGKLYNKLNSSDTSISNQYTSILNYDSLPPDVEIDKTFMLNTLV